MVLLAGTKKVGTARVRDDERPRMTHAQRRLDGQLGGEPRPRVSTDANIPAGPLPVLRHPVAARSTKAMKYRNTKCEHEGIKFDSVRERSRWHLLTQEEADGLISDLRLQVSFVLTERKQRDDGTWERASTYVADFTYVRRGKLVVEDVKSEVTRKNRTYIQKRKQMLEKYGITVKEV